MVRSRMPMLDALRGVAVVTVALGHAGNGATAPIWSQFVDSSWAGVDLFFVLSGFLITGILIDTQTAPHYFRNFYIRRSLRIFPLYYATLLFVLVGLPHLFPLVHANAYWATLYRNKWWLVTYTQNFLGATQPHQFPGFGHFWTLAMEEQFYWFWPLVIRRLTIKQVTLLSACICALGPIVRGILFMNGVSTWALTQLTFTRIDSLAWGALAAAVVRSTPIPRLVKPGFVLGGLLTVATAIYSRGMLYHDPAVTIVGHSGIGCFFASLVLFCSQASFSGRLVQLFSWFGKISYAIYVFHWPMTSAMRLNATFAGLPSFVQFVVSFPLAVAAAYLSWHLLEKHFLNLKERFTSGSSVSRAEVSDQRSTVGHQQTNVQRGGV